MNGAVHLKEQWGGDVLVFSLSGGNARGLSSGGYGRMSPLPLTCSAACGTRM